ncbi:hypothetical protein [Streptomyces sp. NPDC050704]|uniref:phosphotriesterase family protein n=1 Tax=Streptomyces sp. NPDC050704 TaxID=3157219 RepID=UPI00343BD13E
MGVRLCGAVQVVRVQRGRQVDHSSRSRVDAVEEQRQVQGAEQGGGGGPAGLFGVDRRGRGEVHVEDGSGAGHRGRDSGPGRRCGDGVGEAACGPVQAADRGGVEVPEGDGTGGRGGEVAVEGAGVREAAVGTRGIGEVGCDKWYISAAEERSLRAAARAQRASGAAVHTHAARWPVGLPQLDLLTSEGADPARVAIGHCDTVTAPGYAEQIARRGAYVGVDTINTDHAGEVDRRVRMVLDLVRAGYIDNILLSHDVCLISQLRAHGGGGYGFVHTRFREQLLAAGLDAGEFEHITTANPARLLCSWPEPAG